jgi:hypothetical protein
MENGCPWFKVLEFFYFFLSEGMIRDDKSLLITILKFAIVDNFSIEIGLKMDNFSIKVSYERSISVLILDKNGQFLQ